MRCVLKTSDPVTMHFATAVLRDAGVDAVVLDTHMSVMEGSIGIFPRRLMVASDTESAARRLLSEAGLAHELNTRRR